MKNETLSFPRTRESRRPWIPAFAGMTVVLASCAHLSADCIVGAAQPPAAQQEFRSLIGEYGPDDNVVYVLERDGDLVALVKKYEFDPLTKAGTDDYVFPVASSQKGAHLKFTRDASGHVTQATAGKVVLKRRKVGPDEGNTLFVKPLRPVPELLADAQKAQPPQEPGEHVGSDLVDLTTLDPTIHLDIRYATTNNFLQSVFYSQPRAFMQRSAAESLVRVHQRLKQVGYGLLIHDAYRPWYVTKVFWDATPDSEKQFVADPKEGSRHNRGCAVDLSLYVLATGAPVEMVGTYDETSDRSGADYPGGTALQRWHRELLRHAMEADGFTVFPLEWWHFDFKGWQKYPIGNQTFEQIGVGVDRATH